MKGCSESSAPRNVLSTIISLGKKRGINIVADGVETDD